MLSTICTTDMFFLHVDIFNLHVGADICHHVADKNSDLLWEMIVHVVGYKISRKNARFNSSYNIYCMKLSEETL